MFDETWYEPDRGAPTPWGRADVRYVYAEGLSFYSTPSHGGFRLSQARERELDSFLRQYGLTAEDARMGYPAGWYEEDCCALAVMAAFPIVRPESYPDTTAELVERLRGTASRWTA